MKCKITLCWHIVGFGWDVEQGEFFSFNVHCSASLPHHSQVGACGSVWVSTRESIVGL